MNLYKLLDPKYLFEVNPNPNIEYFYILLSFFTLLFLIGVIFNIFLVLNKFSPLLKSYLKSTPSFLYSFAMVGLILVVFRFEGSPYISMRFLLLLTLILFVIWLIRLLYLLIFRYPKRKQFIEEKKRMERYKPGQ